MPNIGSGAEVETGFPSASGTVTAWGTSFGAIAAAARLPAPTTLPIAAVIRNRRRVGSTGGV